MKRSKHQAIRIRRNNCIFINLFYNGASVSHISPRATSTGALSVTLSLFVLPSVPFSLMENENIFCSCLHSYSSLPHQTLILWKSNSHTMLLIITRRQIFGSYVTFKFLYRTAWAGAFVSQFLILSQANDTASQI